MNFQVLYVLKDSKHAQSSKIYSENDFHFKREKMIII